MRKGERTRHHFVKVAADLMNQQGWFTTPLAAVTEGAGLTKGGLYNHFSSMHELTLAAFDYATSKLLTLVYARLSQPGSASERLLTLLGSLYRVGLRQPPFTGGCPLLNAAIEADDGDEALRQRAVEVATRLHQAIAAVIAEGISLGEFRRDLDPQRAARLLFATYEGGVMLAGLHRDEAMMDDIRASLTEIILSWNYNKEDR